MVISNITKTPSMLITAPSLHACRPPQLLPPPLLLPQSPRRRRRMLSVKLSRRCSCSDGLDRGMTEDHEANVCIEEDRELGHHFEEDRPAPGEAGLLALDRPELGLRPAVA